MSSAHGFYDEDTLLERLLNGLKKRRQEVVFVVGSALSAPMALGARGVPGVDGVIDLIRCEFQDDSSQLAKLDAVLDTAGCKALSRGVRLPPRSTWSANSKRNRSLCCPWSVDLHFS
jgi:hypothetical protein